jgi:3-oxoadipate enol-lactonase
MTLLGQSGLCVKSEMGQPSDGFGLLKSALLNFRHGPRILPTKRESPPPRQALAMPTFEQSWGTSYFHRPQPEAPFPLLLFNGLGYTRWSWSWQEWPSDLDPIMIENRGLGGSQITEQSFELSDLADDGANLCSHLGLPRVVVWGVSMGGMIAQEFALRHPTLCAGLILGCTRHGGEDIPLSKQTEERMRNLAHGGWQREALRSGLDLNFAHPLPDQEHFLDLRLAHRPDPSVWSRQVEAIHRFDTSQRLSHYRGPALLMSGDRDVVVPSANLDLLKAKLPQAQTRLYSPAAHVFWVEHAASVTSEVSQFVRACWT